MTNRCVSLLLSGVATLCLTAPTRVWAQATAAPAAPMNAVAQSVAPPATNTAPAPVTAPASTAGVSKVTISEQPAAALPPAETKWWDNITLGTRIT